MFARCCTTVYIGGVSALFASCTLCARRSGAGLLSLGAGLKGRSNVMVRVRKADRLVLGMVPPTAKSSGKKASGAVWKLTGGGLVGLRSRPDPDVLAGGISSLRLLLILEYEVLRLDVEKLLVMLAMLNLRMTWFAEARIGSERRGVMPG